MTEKQKRQLVEEIKTLLSETEGRSDALNYLGDVVADVGCTEEEALAELNRQTGHSP
jgi:hypothetical protein